jgi:hypothetical protein
MGQSEGLLTVSRDHLKLEKIISALQLKIAARELSHDDHRVVIHSLLSKWLPVSGNILAETCQSI